MSGLDSLHISYLDSDQKGRYSKRLSISSNISSTSSYSPSSDHLSFNNNDDQLQRKTSKKGVSTFINKLFSMVEDGTHQNLISWNPNGTSFFVCNATQFAQEVLPEYFKHSNFSSFVRLLNMYGFHKINKSPRGQRGNKENEIWEFSHPKFQHGRPDILKEIKRKAMDSELLRRETGDIHAAFAMLQMSQADLLQQFYILQDNFSNLLQGFEETKKVQLQQQIIIRQLAERQGLQPSDLVVGDAQLDDISRNGNPFKLFVTTPGGQQDAAALNSMQLDSWNQRAHSPDISMSMYDASSPSPSTPMSPNLFESAINTPLPPSPDPSIMIGSPLLGNESPYHMKYEDTNTIGFGYAS